MELVYFPKEEFGRVEKTSQKLEDKLALIAKMCRLNALTEVKKAGSGHLGSSFSAMDIVVYLYYHYLNVRKVGIDDPNRDIYFSSKGHDVPGFYAVLHSLGIIPEEKFLKLRKIDGLDGHPDIKIPGVEANSGSLGMGISKARGMLMGKKNQKLKGKVIVLTGDGEWQEGQNFEALQTTKQQKANDLIVIVDHNKLQSDRLVDRIVSLGDLEKKFKAFGWHVVRCDGHSFTQIAATLKSLETITDKPKIIIADTIKGKGISFMEHPKALEDSNGFYVWHSGAPDDISYEKARDELLLSLKNDFGNFGLGEPVLTSISVEPKPSLKATAEFVAVAYGEALCEQAEKNKNFVVLDADLSFDCKVRDFEFKYPARFFECGIAEQDMVSMAGGLALQGLTPVVNSFASFLASRANEQIYNNSTEDKKIIYSCHYAGLIPAGPGKSHQSVRDISLFGALPNCTILQAANAIEMKQIVDYALNRSPESCMLRINIGPSPKTVEFPANYSLTFGQGVVLTPGKDITLVAYGPVMLNEALKAAQDLTTAGIALRVINMPWLNRFDPIWIERELKNCQKLYILEDHSPFGGLGDNLIDFINRQNLNIKCKIEKMAVEGIPACGTPPEALAYHKLDGKSIAKKVVTSILESL